MTISSMLLGTSFDDADKTTGVTAFNNLVGDGAIPDTIPDATVVFDKLSGITALTTEPEVTNSVALFNKLGGEPIVIQNPLEYEMSVLKTGPEVVQDFVVHNALNFISAPDVGVYAAKTLFSSHHPYTFNGTVYIFHSHFIKELRRQWSGVVEGNGHFSTVEKNLYDQFIKYLNGEPFDTKLQQVLSEIDFWLTEEIQGNTHPEITRVYSETHPWMKIFTRTV